MSDEHDYIIMSIFEDTSKLNSNQSSLALPAVDTDEILIDHVKSHPYLYNKLHVHYRDQEMRKNAWMVIGDAIGIDGPKAETRFTRIRERYSRERKALDSALGSAADYEMTWKLYPLLNFLDPHVPRRMRSSKDIAAKRQSIGVRKFTKNVDDPSSDELATNAQYKEFDISHSAFETEGTGNGDFKRQKIDPISSQITLLTSALTGYLCNQKSKIKSEEEYFGKLIASELCRLPEEVRFEKKRLITQILYGP